MISTIKAKSLRRLLLLLVSFAMLSFLAACGGTLEDGTTSGGEGSVSVSASVESLAAGESSILTATVTDSLGNAVKGQAVAFAFISNKSGATIASLNGGITDSTGQAIASYTAGSGNPSQSVQDNIQVSATGSTRALTITRVSSSVSATGFRLSLTANSLSMIAGNSTIVTAAITDATGSAVSGQAVTFTLLTNNSGATLTILSMGVTDNSGQAFAIYKAGATTPSISVQDTLQASVTGATGVIMLTRLSSAGSSSVVKISLAADSSSVAAGNSTLVRATVTTGDGAAVVGTTVTFSATTNNSGASLVPLNGGITDASGMALATYTAGSNNPTSSVQDIIQASITGATGAIIITRTSSAGTSTGLKLTLSADVTSLEAGESSIITATVTDASNHAVANENVTFAFMAYPSGASLNGTAAPATVTVATDAAGQATVLYTAGSLTASTVQDIVTASITGSTKAIIITKLGSAASATPASLEMTATPLVIKSDGSTTSTITVHALNTLNAELSGIVVTMGASSGILSVPTVTTPGTVTFTSGSNKSIRTASITAIAGSVAADPLLINIVGSTITVATSGSTLPNDGITPITITVTAKDAGNNAVANTTVYLTQAPTKGLGSGSITFAASSGITNASGIFTTTAWGANDGNVTITAQALGATATADITVTPASATFAIDQQRTCTAAYTGCVLIDSDPGPAVNYNPDPASISLSQALEIRVNAPVGVSHVTFATTVGKFNDPNGVVLSAKVITLNVGDTTAGKAVAYLTTDHIGIANIQVYDADAPAISDSLSVAMSSGQTPAKIILQASPTVVPVSVGDTTGSSTLTATVYDASNNPLGGQPVAFEIVDGYGTSGGETIAPVVVLTATTASGGLSVGQARSTFTSGSMPSAGTGVKVRASVVGTTVQTGTSPSGNDVAILIGGVAGSIAFGQDYKAAEYGTSANYVFKMSVLVADSNGNPVEGAVVNLGVWPIAWATGVACAPDPDGFTWDPTGGPDSAGAYVVGPGGIFWNEDTNENLILDGGEDGKRLYYANSLPSPDAGTLDGLITPTNSASGTVPAAVTTDKNGVAGFDLIYPKTSAMFTWDRIRATTTVQGTETRAEMTLYLRIVAGQEVICAESPYNF